MSNISLWNLIIPYCNKINSIYRRTILLLFYIYTWIILNTRIIYIRINFIKFSSHSLNHFNMLQPYISNVQQIWDEALEIHIQYHILYIQYHILCVRSWKLKDHAILQLFKKNVFSQIIFVTFWSFLWHVLKIFRFIGVAFFLQSIFYSM